MLGEILAVSMKRWCGICALVLGCSHGSLCRRAVVIERFLHPVFQRLLLVKDVEFVCVIWPCGLLRFQNT